jgi:hypothetical protein
VDVDCASVGETESGGDEAVSAELAADRLPVSRVVVGLQAFADSAQQVVCGHADELGTSVADCFQAVRRVPWPRRQRHQHVAVNVVLQLMEIRPQSECAFVLAKAGPGLE